MLTAWCSTSGPIELTVGVLVVRFEIPIYAFAAGACSSTAGCGLDHHERGLILLRNLRRRQPSLLQRGKLAEQRFLQRPSHTLSLQPVKFAAPLAQRAGRRYTPRAQPARSTLRSAEIGSSATLLDHQSPELFADLEPWPLLCEGPRSLPPCWWHTHPGQGRPGRHAAV
jgi:hypothetical protein